MSKANKFCIYLRIPGVPGDVSGGRFDGCFTISSYQFGVGRAVSSGGGYGRRRRQRPASEEKKREVSDPSVSEISVTIHGWNAHMTFLAGLQMAGNHPTPISPCIIGVCFPVVEIISGDSILTLTDCIVSGFSVSSDRPNPPKPGEPQKKITPEDTTCKKRKMSTG